MQPGISQRMIKLARSVRVFLVRDFWRSPVTIIGMLIAALTPVQAYAQKAGVACGKDWWLTPFDCIVVKAVGGAIGIVVNILTYIVYIISVLFGWIVSIVVRFMKPFILESNRITQIEEISALWSNVRDLANALLILVLLVAAVLVIVRYEKGNYTIKQVLPKVVTAVLLINFSKLIIQVLVDFFHVAATGTYQLLASGITVGENAEPFTEENALAGLFDGMRIPDMLTTIQATSQVSVVSTGSGKDAILANVQLLIASFLIVALMFLIVVSAVSVLILYVTRIVALGLLTIVSPLAVLASVLPQTKQYADKFWKEVIKYASLPLILAAFFAFAVRINSLFLDVGEQVNKGSHKFGPDELPGLPKIEWATLINIIIVTMIIKEGVKQAKSGSFAEAAVTATENTMNKYGKKVATEGRYIPTAIKDENGKRKLSFQSAGSIGRSYKELGAGAYKEFIGKGSEVAEEKMRAHAYNSKIGKAVDPNKAESIYGARRATEVKEFIEAHGESSPAEKLKELAKLAKLTNLKDKTQLAKSVALIDNIGQTDELRSYSDAEKVRLAEEMNKANNAIGATRKEDPSEAAKNSRKLIGAQLKMADIDLGFYADKTSPDKFDSTKPDYEPNPLETIGGSTTNFNREKGIKASDARRLAKEKFSNLKPLLDSRQLNKAVVTRLFSDEFLETSPDKALLQGWLRSDPILKGDVKLYEEAGTAAAGGAAAAAPAPAGGGAVPPPGGGGPVPLIDTPTADPELAAFQEEYGTGGVTVGGFLNGSRSLALDFNDPSLAPFKEHLGSRAFVTAKPDDAVTKQMTPVLAEMFRGQLDARRDAAMETLEKSYAERIATEEAWLDENLASELEALRTEEEKAQGVAPGGTLGDEAEQRIAARTGELQRGKEDALTKLQSAKTIESNELRTGMDASTNKMVGAFVEELQAGLPVVLTNRARKGQTFRHGANHEAAHVALAGVDGTAQSDLWNKIPPAQREQFLAQIKQEMGDVVASDEQAIEEIFAEGLADGGAEKFALPPEVLSELQKLKEDARTRMAEHAAAARAKNKDRGIVQDLQDYKKFMNRQREYAQPSAPTDAPPV